MARVNAVSVHHPESDAPPSKGINSLSKLLSPKYQSQSSLREQNRNCSSPKCVHFVKTITIIKKEERIVEPNEAKDNDHIVIAEMKEKEREDESHDIRRDDPDNMVLDDTKGVDEVDEESEESEREVEEEEDDLEYFDTFPTIEKLGYHEWLLNNPRPLWVSCKKVRKRHCKSGTKSNAIFALPGHGSTSSVGRKSNAIFALPGHGSTSSVGRKSNAIFALPGHGNDDSDQEKTHYSDSLNLGLAYRRDESVTKAIQCLIKIKSRKGKGGVTSLKGRYSQPSSRATPAANFVIERPCNLQPPTGVRSMEGSQFSKLSQHWATLLKKEKEEAQQQKFLENLKQLHINIPFTEALSQMPKYAKFLKWLLLNKTRLEEAYTVTMNERCSTVLLNKLLSKEKDPGSFTIPYDIGLGEPKPTRMSLELADRSIQYPRGIAENILIKIDKFILPIDFVILDMREDSKIPIIIGRPFLATAWAMIDVFNKKIMLENEPRTKLDKTRTLWEPLVWPKPIEEKEGVFVGFEEEKKELIEDNQLDSFLVNNLEESVDLSILESCGKADDIVKSRTPIRPIEEVNTPYSRETIKTDKAQNEHLYSVSANEIDEKRPVLKDLPSYLEYAYLKGDESCLVIISSKLTEKEKVSLLHDSFKLLSHQKIKRRQILLVLMELLPTEGCRLDYAMIRRPFKDA
ncbi:DNA-directed DNA polymerase [Tanacetum coccineum]